MNNKNKERRGYTIIEPPNNKMLHLNCDLWVAYLQVVCNNLPNLFKDFPESIKYEVLLLGNPYGAPYPAIGFYTDKPEDLEQIPNSLDFDEEVENWISEDKFNLFIEESKQLNSISWEELKNREPK
ncbi:hypothetical protein AB9K26_00230 [Psychroserpens sp. XS_ASV72]|uniref:hypothetical protein n=1 Tax=Psychroserpens sp. XS_ASV72 TaxID=3241293 RepID=UPI003519111E